GRLVCVQSGSHCCPVEHGTDGGAAHRARGRRPSHEPRFRTFGVARTATVRDGLGGRVVGIDPIPHRLVSVFSLRSALVHSDGRFSIRGSRYTVPVRRGGHARALHRPWPFSAPHLHSRRRFSRRARG